MTIRAADIIPISTARARLTELVEDVVAGGEEKILTKQGFSYVALVDARKLDYYHALEAEYANLMLAEDAIAGLEDAVGDGLISDEVLQSILHTA